VKIKDAESATHAYEAAWHQVVDTYEVPGFEIVQFELGALSHYSYVLISETEALVVDPSRDINAYLDLVSKRGLTVKGVFLTHSHADFVAGHMEIAKATGCPIYASATSGDEFDHQPLREGSSIQIGKATVKILETPGHTPDGLCATVHSTTDAAPSVVFTGDTLFVGSIGRP